MAQSLSMSCHDDGFTPTVYNDICDRFDFSLLFEDAIFAILPAALVIVATPVRFAILYKRTPKARWTSLHMIKPAVIIVYCLLKLVFLVLRIRDHSTPRTIFTIAAVAFDFVSAVSVGILSYYEHVKSARPAPLITTFLLLTSLLDGARARTQWLLRVSPVIPSIFFASLDKNYATEETAGIFSLTFFAWLIPLIGKGYRHPLSIDDLYPVDNDIASATVVSKLRAAWQSSGKDHTYSLFMATARALWIPLCLPMIPQLFLVAFSLAQPFLINTAMNFVENMTDRPVIFGYSLIGAFGLTYLGIAATTAWYQYLVSRVLAMIRGALISLTYESMLEMESADSAASSPISLINVDVDRIVTSLQWVIVIAPDALQVGIAVWLLEARLGAVCVAPVLVVLASGLASGQVGKYTRPRQRLWMQAIETRTKATSEVLNSMKGVKMLGLTPRISEHIQGLREKELQISKRYRKIQISNIIMGNTPRLLSPIIMFIGYGIIIKLSGDEAPDTATIFSSLSLLSILIDPVNELVAIGPNLAAALDCFNRIQEYVFKEKRLDYRKLSCQCEEMPTEDQTKSSKDGKKEESTTIMRLENKPSGAEIRLADVNAGWSKKTHVLHNISLKIERSTLNIVIGDVGSGKSTFLRLLLGDVTLMKGSVALSTEEIAFCDQIPFIRNQSIRDNIIGPLGYDSEWYNTCIAACALDIDFQQMPQEDSTVVGSKGIALSGGQKQRIALARAAYARKKLILLDDVLSGLDNMTGSHCFHRLLGSDGILRRHMATVVFVTHSVDWLPYADNVIVLGRKGGLEQTGSYETLVSEPGYVRDLKLKLGEKMSDSNISFANRQRISGHKFEESTEKSVKLAEAETAEPDAGIHSDSPSILFYIGSMGWMRFSTFIVLVAVEVGTNSMQPLWLSWWTDANQKHPDASLGRWMGVYAAFGMLSLCFLGLGGAYLLIYIVPKSSITLHWKVLKSTMRAPMTFFSKTSSGRIINLFSQDMTLIDIPLPIALILATGSFGNSIAGVVLTSVSSGYMALSIPILMVSLYFLQRLYLRTSKQIRFLDLEAKSPLLERFMESLQGLVTIRALSWTHHVKSENFHRLDQSQKPFYLLLCIQRWLSLVLNSVIAVLGIVLMSLTVALRASIDPGLLGVAMVSIVNFGQTLSSFIIYWTTLETSLTAVSRIKKCIEETPVDNSDSQTVLIEEMPPDWPTEPNIEIQHVSASYSSIGKQVLADITISIPSAQRIAICGRSGSGKSTLISLLLGLLKPSEGNIFIGNHDVSRYTQQAISERLTVIPQEAWFMPRGCDSVRENLDPFGTGASDESIHDALEKTGLREHIDQIGGLAGRLEQGDGVLSVGQKQLFCLARAMLTRRGKILIMDEATSSVDYQTESKILSLLQSEFQGWTIIAIVHRLKFVPKYFDRVLVMDEGRVVEYDTPEHLLSNPSSLFKQMTEVDQLKKGNEA